MVFQFIERKENITQPTNTGVITRKLIEDEYDLIGYTVFMLNNRDGTIRHGTYVLDLHDGPIFIEELDPLKKNDKRIRITIARPGDNINKTEVPPH
jgi:hypothetical protein